jgi:methionine-rich copper-binding protein CopC
VTRSWQAFAAALAISGCAPTGGAAVEPPANEAQSAAIAGSPATILAGSTPADGASLAKSPENLTLRFSRPVRLHEVTVTGSDGTLVPIMVTAVVEEEYFSIPMPELEPGSYAVSWRAEGAGETHRGVIRFTVR